MALIKCPECGNRVLETETSCPNCGFYITPIAIKRSVGKARLKVTVIVLSVVIAILLFLTYPILRRPDDLTRGYAQIELTTVWVIETLLGLTGDEE